MQGEDELSIEELASNLSTYKEQLQQVRQILVDDPGNLEYVDMEKELAELVMLRLQFGFSVEKWNQPTIQHQKVIEISVLESTCCSNKQHQLTATGSAGGVLCVVMASLLLIHLISDVIALTEELLATAKQNEISGSDIGTSYSAPPAQSKEAGKTSDYGDKFPVGTKVQAVWSEDGEWYDATVEAITPNGYFVLYDGWGNKEEVLRCSARQQKRLRPFRVDPANVRAIEYNALLEAEKVAEATKQAIKRKIAQAASVDFQSRSLPAKLRITADDPEDVKAAKRKKIHAFKSKMRFEQLEVAQNKRQNAWQQFQTTKGKTKKVGFFSGRKRESIFKSPDDPHGKVGVTGSGKGLTEFQKREKHLHLKGGNVEINDD
ncbi:Nucleic acid binding,RNA binding isoform 1 [Theobroma cacao]|uniref:Survival of motor neuron-related-splicing factor 30 n=1 Tax=Theobroma cacao TaxID=3641 RepID=A0A061G7E7_THECC|nr:Nucleic acid binding,RNA binding isoform 1 [Theobroma cacao]